MDPDPSGWSELCSVVEPEPELFTVCLGRTGTVMRSGSGSGSNINGLKNSKNQN